MPTAPFNWAEFLRLATDLSQNADEASQRTAISRAYYSIFHAATIQAKRNGYAGGGHKELWVLYAKDPDRQCKKLAQMAYTMKEARIDADYHEVYPKLADQMEQQLVYANDFIARLSTVPQTSPQP